MSRQFAKLPTGTPIARTAVVSLPGDATEYEWLDARLTGVGGTDAAAITGHNKYKSALTLHYEKTGEVDRNRPLLTPDHPAWWGLALEGSIRIAFEYQTGLRVYDAPKLIRHRSRRWQYASLDGLVCDGDDLIAGFEAKTGGFHMLADWPTDNPEAIPAAYLVQVHHYMMVTGLEKFYVCALLGGQHFTIREVHRDPELENHLLQKEEEFWTGVHARTPPPPDGADNTQDTIRNLYPRPHNDSDIELPAEQEPVLERYLQAHRELNAWKAEKARAAQELQLAIGDATGAWWHDRRAITWDTVTVHQWDTKALAADHPELASQYRKPVLTRPLRVLATQWKDLLHGNE